MNIGWYSEIYPSHSEKSILYFNHVVNAFTPNADKNDVRIYTKENYIQCIKNLPVFEKNGVTERFFVHLPYFQVYTDQSGNDIVIFDWYKDIIDATYDLPQVCGYYIADEPEVWGTEFTSTKTPFDQQMAMDAYSYCKERTNKPVLLVFCDRSLFLKSGMNKTINKICDILAFDFYPFMTQKQIDSKNLGFTAGDENERRWIKDEINKFTKFYSELETKNQHTPYWGFVTQGCGEFDKNRIENFGQRDFTSEDLNFLYTTVLRSFKEKPEYYFFWDKAYADDNAFGNAWGHIINIPNLDYLAWYTKPKKPSIIQKIVGVIKKKLKI
jgi:hypothetical protein